MHTLIERTTRVGVMVVVGTASFLAFMAEPVAADECLGRGCQHQGDQTPGGYSAWAAFASVWGGGSTPGPPQPCSFERTTPDPEAIYGNDPGIVEEVDGFIQVHVSGENPLGGTEDDAPYVIVSVSCTEPGYEDAGGNEFGAIDRYELLEFHFVPVLDPAELVEQALADMPVGSPDIQTSPGEGNPSLVGIETWLMIDEASFAQGSRTDSDGPVSVTVWAEPDPNGDVVWDTGEGTRTCTGSSPGGTCTWTYQRSSIEQPYLDGAGRPAYGITASVTYIGGYSVSLFGVTVGGVDDLGDISRTSDPYFLAVEEAQVLNTGA